MAACNYKLLNYKLPNVFSRFLQLGVLLHQLLQTKSRELYRNLGLFPISFALVDGSLAVFGMANLLARPKALLAGRRLNRHLGQGKFLSPRGEELGDILD